MQSEFEELILKSEKDLQRIRSIYFPLIDKRIITGYNLYHNLFDYSNAKLFLNYLHSDLKPEDKHFQELSRILKLEGFLEERIIINNKLVDREEIIEREADYITRPHWKDPKDMRYFDERGIELSRDEAKNLGKDIIGESFQYDLLLRVSNEKELRRLVDLFKNYVSKDKLDKHGRKIIGKNQSAIFGAQDIPLLVCTTKNNKKPPYLVDFLKVNQFDIPEKLGNISITLSTLVGSKSKELQKFLDKQGYKIRSTKKYAFRIFVEYYLDV